MIDLTPHTKSLNDMSKQFLCFWGEGYAKHVKETYTLEFFNETNGYAHDDIARIATLAVGQAIDLSDLSGIHTITRIN